MPKICYEDATFDESQRLMIKRANQILAEYEQLKIILTLRTLHYQFASRWPPPPAGEESPYPDPYTNNDKSYDRLGRVMGKARMAGRIDWEALVDRVRSTETNNHWDSPTQLIEACAKQFQIDKWARQPEYVEVWVEKDAVIGIIESLCKQLDVPYMAMRGYSSITAIWEAAYRRFGPRIDTEEPKECHVFYLGDHDPAGLDMSDDVQRRLNIFTQGLAANVRVHRLGLNYDQIQQFNPPALIPKEGDSRTKAYIAEYGNQCWELDALDPLAMRQLIRDAVMDRIDRTIWEEDVASEHETKRHLAGVARNWDTVVKNLPKSKGKDEDIPNIFDDLL